MRNLKKQIHSSIVVENKHLLDDVIKLMKGTKTSIARHILREAIKSLDENSTVDQ